MSPLNSTGQYVNRPQSGMSAAPAKTAASAAPDEAIGMGDDMPLRSVTITENQDGSASCDCGDGSDPQQFGSFDEAVQSLQDPDMDGDNDMNPASDTDQGMGSMGKMSALGGK